MRNLRDWSGGDSVLNTEHHQQAVDALRELSDYRPGTGEGDTGPRVREEFIARVVAKGPDGEAGHADARYWLQRQIVEQAEFRAALTLSEDISPEVKGDVETGGVNFTEPNTFTATNLAERSAGTHLLTEGTEVRCWAWWSKGDPQQKHYLFDRPPPASSFWAKITGSAANGDNRWKYAWAEQRRTANGVQDQPGGRSGTTDARFALNSVEMFNAATGVQGNGIDVDGDAFAGFAIQPAVTNGTVVRMHLEADDEGNPAYTFQYENGVDGECE